METTNQTMETRVCKYCGREMTTDKFYKNAWGLTSCCKECHTQRMLKGKREKKALEDAAAEVEMAKTLRLQDFTPRQLMEELHRRGYEGKLRYVQVQEIDLSNF